MLYSGLKFADMVDILREEVNIALPVSSAIMCVGINALEQLIYTDYIKEHKRTFIDTNGEDRVILSDIPHEPDESPMLYEDIVKVYGRAYDTRMEYTKGSVISGQTFHSKPIYWKNGVNLEYNDMLGVTPESIELVYYVRPAIKTPENMGDMQVMIPVEFLSMVYAYMRCEMYKLAANVTSSAQWANEYNAWIETFTQWVNKHNQIFGEG